MKKLVAAVFMIAAMAGTTKAQSLFDKLDRLSDKVDRASNSADRASNTADRAGRTGGKIVGMFSRKKKQEEPAPVETQAPEEKKQPAKKPGKK